MKLDQKVLAFIKQVISACKTAGIENAIIERNRVRAIQHGKDDSVVVIVHNDVPQLPVDVIGLSRIDIFSSRLTLAEEMPNFAVDINTRKTYDPKENKDIEMATILTMTAKGLKVEYRCANPAAIKAPKSIKDVFKFGIKYQPDAIAMMTKGIAAMDATYVTLVANEKGISFEIIDVNNDVLTYDLIADVTPLEDDAEPSFVFKYPAKTLVTLLKNSTEPVFEIGQGGMLKCNVDKIDVAVMPKA